MELSSLCTGSGTMFSRTLTTVKLIFCRANGERKQLTLSVFSKTINSYSETHHCNVAIFPVLILSSFPPLFFPIYLRNPLKTSAGTGMHGALLYKRWKTLQPLRILCRMSNFQRNASLLACMHNHTSECPHVRFLKGI